MEVSVARFLASPAGAAALGTAAASRGEPEARRRSALGGLDAATARAVLAQDDLRVRAAAKTPLADRLLFTREALEQATAEPVAAERASRFAGFATVADLGAGVGLDAIALARAGCSVVAVERDPARAVLLAHNAAVAAPGRVRAVEADFLEAPPEAAAAFLDPDRRPGGARTRDAEAFEPPERAWAALAARYGHLLAKLPPATAPRQGVPTEWVSLDGTMREARRGWGALAPAAPRRALCLPTGASVVGTGLPWPAPRAPREGDVLVEPDPAVVVAGLVGDAATAAGAAPVHPRIAYLLGARAVPWGRCDRVLEVLPADPRRLRAALASRGAGDLEIRSRGVEGSPQAWRRRIAARGRARATVVLTRGPDDRYLALLTQPAAAPTWPAG